MPMPLFALPLADSKFTLNPLEFVGMIGGTEVISVMSMIPLYEGRRWLGWYNTPGSLDIARHLADFASSFQPSPFKNLSPTALLGLDGKAGPMFVAALSGLETRTGHLGYLTVEQSKEMALKSPVEMIAGRNIFPTFVTLLELRRADSQRPLPLRHLSHTLFALIPITTSIVTCLFCGFVSDWYMFSVILFGMFTSGFASVVIGSRNLIVQSGQLESSEAPPAIAENGVLLSGDTVIVVRGNESAVSTITKGGFKLEGDESWYWQFAVYICALLYFGECVAQLILIPQGTLFGQITFVVSLCVSWGYSYILASLKKEKLQAELLFSELGNPQTRKFRVGTKAARAVFVCLLVFHGVRHLASADEYRRTLTALLPSASPVWRRWGEIVISQLEHWNDASLSHLEVQEQYPEIYGSDLKLLNELVGDAKVAFEEYIRTRDPLPTKLDSPRNIKLRGCRLM